MHTVFSNQQPATTMIEKALQFVGRSIASVFGASEKRKTLDDGSRKVTTREEWLRERRRQHCMRNQLVFGAPRGTKSHRRFYYMYNPSWFAPEKPWTGLDSASAEA